MFLTGRLECMLSMLSMLTEISRSPLQNTCSGRESCGGLPTMSTEPSAMVVRVGYLQQLSFSLL